HVRRILVPLENLVKLGRAVRLQLPASIAMKNCSQGTAEHAFIGGHPLHAQIMRNGQRLIGYAAFRRPHAFWPSAKNLLMQGEAALNLLTRIFRMAESLRRQRQPMM